MSIEITPIPVDLSSIDVYDVPDKYTVGHLSVRQLSPVLGVDIVQMVHVEFEPGARFRPHMHPADQVLFYISGNGVVAIDGGVDVVVPAGSAVRLPAGVPHMHGATADGPAVHIAVIADRSTEWLAGGIPGWERWMPSA